MTRPGRTITGMSAVFLPHVDESTIDWPAFEAHVARTVEAGLVPGVNMDTGFVQLLPHADRAKALEITTSIAGDGFVAGAFVDDAPGSPLQLDAHLAAATAIRSAGGTPVIFPSHGLNALDEDRWVDAHARLAGELDRFIAFELGPMFVPYGRIYSLDAYRGLLELESCIGAKHSSLQRQLEWDRLRLRDEVRPDFKVFTGNDLAIDMVMYGSDYLLGLSTFDPAAFAMRDRLWAEQDPRFHELNDLLQYLGQFTFRAPVPAYRHDAAMFFALRGWATADAVPAAAPRRPASDREVLTDILERLEAWR